MKLLSVIIVLVAVSCSASAYITITPEKTANSLALLSKPNNDLFTNSRNVIEKLVETIRGTAQDALDAVGRFTTSVQLQAQAARERIAQDIQKLRTRVTEAIEALRKRLTDSGALVRDCIASREHEATGIFNEALNKTRKCANERISEISPQISDLRVIGKDGLDFANKTMADMRKCTEGGEGLLAAGSCLGSITLQAELKALKVATRASLTMGRISLAVATLPATLEVCAGSHVVEAGLGTSRLLMEIGTCSAASVFTMMTGNTEFQSNAF